MYNPLDESKRQVRLLHLHSGAPDSALSCSFSLASLDDNPEFEALSYTWGARSGSKSISVHGQLIIITDNLHSALINLRYPDDRERVLWVDALCINQEDVEEKSWQVAMMGDVYTHATLVLAYLGDNFEDVDLAIQAIKQIAADPTLHLYSYIEHGLSVQGMGCESTRLLQCLAAFFGTTWITRAWTCQEYLVASSLIFVYGRCTIQNDALHQMFEHYTLHASSCCRITVQQMTRDPAELPDENVRRQWTDARLQWAGLLTVSRDRKVWVQNRRSSLLILEHFRRREAMNPRDYIYSALGMGDAEWAQLVRPVDYASEPVEVFKRAVHADLVTRKRLDFLCFCNSTEESKDDVNKPKMPSWVPNWSARMQVTAGFHGQRMTFRTQHNACDDRLARDARIVGDQLIVSGLRLGTIIASTAAMSHGHVGQMQRTFEAINIMYQVYNGFEFSRVQRYLNEDVWSELHAIRLVFIGGWDRNPGTRDWSLVREPRNEVAFQILDQIMQAEDPFVIYQDCQSRFTTEMHHLDTLILTAMVGRRFVALCDGRIGLAPAECEAGDIVVVLEGGPVPYVLRKEANEEHYRYIGDSYMLMAMEGEAFQSMMDGQSLETFVLV